MKKAQALVKQFVSERDWDKQLPDQVAKSIAIEAAELLEIFQWSNPTSVEIQTDPKKMAEIEGELADVLIYSLQMATLLGLEIEKVVEAKLVFAAKKYPIELMRKRSAGEPEAHERYLEIKKVYRQKKK